MLSEKLSRVIPDKLARTNVKNYWKQAYHGYGVSIDKFKRMHQIRLVINGVALGLAHLSLPGFNDAYGTAVFGAIGLLETAYWSTSWFIDHIKHHWMQVELYELSQQYDRQDEDQKQEFYRRALQVPAQVEQEWAAEVQLTRRFGFDYAADPDKSPPLDCVPTPRLSDRILYRTIWKAPNK